MLSTSYWNFLKNDYFIKKKEISRNHIHHLCTISLFSSSPLILNYKRFKTKVPEAWYEEKDKYNLFPLSFLFFLNLFFVLFLFFLQYILFVWCSFCDVKLERHPQTFESLLTVCFGRALLWHHCCKKKKRSKATDRPLVLIFLVFHCYCPGFRKEFSLEGTLLWIPKRPQ